MKPDMAALRRAGARARPLLLALAFMAGFVAADQLTVVQRDEVSLLYAERFTLGEHLTVERSDLLPVKSSRAALGTAGAPVEVSADLLEATTLLTQDHWSYVVILRETGATALGVGNYTAELFLDSGSKGVIHFTQAIPLPAVTEGIRLIWDLGAELPRSALLSLVVKREVIVGPLVEYTVKSTPAGDLRWLGIGGAIAGQTNPTLRVTTGETLRVTAENGDGITHNIGLRRDDDTLIDPPGWSADIETVGQRVIVTWSPPGPGSFTYVCKYHPTTMRGTVTVSG